MFSSDAEDIALKMVQSWPRSSVTMKSWTDELIELDKGRAEEVARRLVRNSDSAPTIAHFFNLYRELAGTYHEEEKCVTCGGDRWVADLLHPWHGGYWQQRSDDKKTICTPPVALDADGKPDPNECICNIVRQCPTCNAPKDRT